MKYPHLFIACQIIAYDNGGVNRERSSGQRDAEYFDWISKQNDVDPVEEWLRTLDYEQIEDVCCGGDDKLIDVPEFVDDFLNKYFQEVD